MKVQESKLLYIIIVNLKALEVNFILNSYPEIISKENLKRIFKNNLAKSLILSAKTPLSFCTEKKWYFNTVQKTLTLFLNFVAQFLHYKPMCIIVFFVCICTKPVCIILFWKTVANFTNYLFFFTTRINRWMIALSNVAVICWTKTDFCYCCCPFCFVLLSTEKKQHMKSIKNLSNKVYALVVVVVFT